MLKHHLQYNHYPPVLATDLALDSCEAAIQAVNEDDLDRIIVGDTPAWKLIEDLHLQDFLGVEDDE
jgi:hypothetical protein